MLLEDGNEGVNAPGKPGTRRRQSKTIVIPVHIWLFHPKFGERPSPPVVPCNLREFRFSVVNFLARNPNASV